MTALLLHQQKHNDFGQNKIMCLNEISIYFNSMVVTYFKAYNLKKIDGILKSQNKELTEMDLISNWHRPLLKLT